MPGVFARSLLLTACCVTIGSSSPSPVASTSFGRAIGVANGACEKWLGIPFAKPPLGSLRFASPQPWTANYPASGLSATKPGEVCTQNGAGGEDCLFLNIWRPADVNIGTLLPVMVWIHGGSFEMGSGSDRNFDACELVVAQEVVAASMNYRLGPFGYASFQDGNGVSANYGMQDQREAMKWLQNELKAFGGDASKVTLFGESAGAISVLYHMVSPLSKGLFRAAISESGFPSARALKQAADDTQKFAASLGCTGQGGDLAACLQRLPAERILAAAKENPAKPFSNISFDWGPVVDGVDMPVYPAKLWLEGRSHSVPLMGGTNTDEGNLFIYPEHLLKMDASAFRETVVDLNEVTENVAKLNASGFSLVYAKYPAVQADNRPLAAQLLTDATFLCGTWYAMNKHSKRVDTFVYRFDHHSSCPGDPAAKLVPGAFHGTEIPYVFGHSTDAAGIPCWLSSDEKALSSRMQTLWANFAKYLNPTPHGASENLGTFPRYNSSSRIGRVFRAAADGHDEDYRGQFCNVWDALSLSKIAHADDHSLLSGLIV